MKNKLSDLVDLMAFIEIANGKDFRETATKLSVTQPAITQKIHRLEDRFGVKLFRRIGHKMHLTGAGKVLEPMSRDLIRLARHVDETMTSIQGAIESKLIIGCSTALGKHFLTRLIALFQIEYPFVQTHIECMKNANVLDKLSTGDITLVFTSKKCDHPTLEQINYFTDDIILVAPANHAWAGIPYISLDDLLNEPIILREEGAGSRDFLFESMKVRGITLEDLSVVMELGNAEAIENAVEEGIGVAFISRLTCTRGLKLGRIVEITVGGLEIKQDLYIVRDKAHVPTHIQQIFCEFAASQNILVQLGLDSCTPYCTDI